MSDRNTTPDRSVAPPVDDETMTRAEKRAMLRQMRRNNPRGTDLSLSPMQAVGYTVGIVIGLVHIVAGIALLTGILLLALKVTGVSMTASLGSLVVGTALALMVRFTLGLVIGGLVGDG